MTLRPYDPDADFKVLQSWIGDRRTHAMWCAGRIPWPLERESFHRFLEDLAGGQGERPFIAAAEDGTPVGFFCAPVQGIPGDAMLKFVVVSPECRGRGLGREMVTMAVDRIFSQTGARHVLLNVFSVNTAALRCYQRAGFILQRETEAAFAFDGELWGRCAMAAERKDDTK